MWLDYMTDNKDNIVKSVGLDEYNKMLKDGMVNVKAGTGLELVFDKDNNLSLKDISGSISHIEHPDLSHIDTSHVNGSDVTAEDAIVQQDITNEMHSSSASIQSEMNNMSEIPANGIPGTPGFDSNFANTDLHRLLV